MLSKISSISKISMMARNRNRLVSESNSQVFKNFLASSPDPKQQMPMQNLKSLIDSEARENKKKATAQNNPITGFHFEVNEQGNSLQMLSIEENKNDLQMSDELFNLNNVNVKSSNFLPAIPASGLDKRQMIKKGGKDSFSQVLLQHSNVAAQAQMAANKRYNSQAGLKHNSAMSSYRGSIKKGNTRAVGSSPQVSFRQNAAISSQWEKGAKGHSQSMKGTMANASHASLKNIGNHSKVMDTAFERLNDDIKNWESSKIKEDVSFAKKMSSQDQLEAIVRRKNRSMAEQNMKYLQVQMQQKKEADALNKLERQNFQEDHRYMSPSEQTNFVSRVNMSDKNRLSDLSRFQMAQMQEKL